MTALARERMTDFAGPVPARGTYSIKANVQIFKGAFVALDSAGRVMPAGTIAAGAVVAVGKASATYNNLTGSALGGAADACEVEVEFGVFGWDNSAAGEVIANTEVGKLVYLVDDHTVGKTSATATLIVAGVCTEVRNGKVFVWSGPHVFPLTA